MRSLILSVAILLVHVTGLAAPAEPSNPNPATSKNLTSSLLRLPLAFEENRWQSAPTVSYFLRARGYTASLTRTGLQISFNSRSNTRVEEIVQITFVGTDGCLRPDGTGLLPGTVNYYLGHDIAQWQTNIRRFRQVRCSNLYPGIDLVLYGSQGELEFDFDVAAGAKASTIRLQVTGAKVQRKGRSLELITSSGRRAIIKQPVLYQTGRTGRYRIAGGYALRAGNEIGFFTGSYDHSRPLIIDPALIYSTFAQLDFTDTPFAVAVDNTGAAYITGQAFVQGPTGGNSNSDAVFIMKFDNTGSSLVYETFLGGHTFPPQGFPQNTAAGHAISVDTSGNTYVVGLASEPDFPTTANTYSPKPFCTSQGQNLGCVEPFAAKLNATGTVVFSTYLVQPSQMDTFGPVPSAMAVDANGAIYVTGTLSAQKFSNANPPLSLAGLTTTTGAFQTARGNTSSDFVLKLHPDGSTLDYATYLGGSTGETPGGVAVDATGVAYIDGGTSSIDFPVTPGAFQTTINSSGAFFTKLSANGSSLVFSTFLGDQGTTAWAIALDNTNAAYLTGDAGASFPTTPGAFNATACACNFVTKFDSSDNLSYSTFVGLGVVSNRQSETSLALVSATSIAVDTAGAAYISALSRSSSYPLSGAIQTSPSIFVSKLQPGGSALAYSTFFGPANPPSLENPFGGMALDGTQHTVTLAGFADDVQDPNTQDAIPGVATTASAFQSTPPTTVRSPRIFVAKIADSLGAAVPAPNPRAVIFSTVQQQGTTSSPRTVRLNNYGDASLAISSIAIGGANASDFAISRDSCPSSLGVAASCTILVTFTPTVPTGVRNAMINLTFGGGVPAQAVMLSGSAPGDDSFNITSQNGVTSNTVSQGQTATYNLVVAAGTSFSGTGPIIVSCSGAPANASCNPSPNSIPVPSGQGTQQNVVVAVNTTAPSMASLRKTRPGFSWVLAVAFGALLIHPRRRKLRHLLLMLGALALLGTMLSCGGGGESGGSGGGNPGTPQGTFTLTVTASANGATNSLPLTLTVQ